MADRQFGPYRLVRQIAVGGMAEIYLAKVDARPGGDRTERHVALKMIHPNFAEDEQFIEMLIDEARISIQLHHHNIAHTFDLGRFHETYYLIMEFVDGADLYKILRRGSEHDIVTPVDVAAYVVQQVAQALDYAHHKCDEQGQPLHIVHRDVSPQNVLVAYDGGVKLVDFGIAKATSKAQQTAAGVIKGKYYYMSPEQALGEPLDPRTDIFSAGIVLYELLTGQMLYLEEDVNRLLDRVRRADIAPVRSLRRDVPSQLERIVMRALARRREERYQTAADLAADLERFLDVYAPAFTPRKMVTFMQDALGDNAGPLLPTTQLPAAPAAPVARARNKSRPPPTELPDEISDENSMLFRISELAPPGRRQANPAAGMAAPAPAPRRAPPRASDQRTAPVAHPTDEIDSTAVSERPRRNQTSDEPPTSAAGPRGVRRNVAPPAAPPPSIDLDDYEPTVMDQIPSPAGPEARAPAPEPPEAHDSFDDGPTFTRDASPLVAVGDGSTAARGRGPSPQAAAMAARTTAPEPSTVRRPRESRRTPPGGTGAPSVLQAIVGQPAPPHPHPRPARGAGAPLSDGVPAAVAEPSSSSAPTAPAAGRGPASGRNLSLGVQAGRLDPAFDAPTSPGDLPGGIGPASPVPPRPPAPPAPQPWAPEPWPGSNTSDAYPSPPPPPPPPGAVPVYPFQPPPGQQTLSRQLMALDVDELPAQYRLKPSGGSVALRIALVVVVLLGIAAAIGLVVQGGGESRPPPSIIIDSSPAGATVLVDGLVLPEKTPTVFRNTAPGKRHELELRLAGHKTFRDAVLVPDDGGEVRVLAPLLARTVTLTIKTEPPGANVLIDDRLVGTTQPGSGLTVNDLSPEAPTRVEVRLKGYQPHVEKVTWADAEETRTLPISLRR